MPSKSPQERSLVSRIGAYEKWANTADRTAATKAARRAFDKRFEQYPDPTVEIQWSELERGHWVAECVCGTEHYHEPRTRPARLDPLDPRTAHHLPRCEFASETNPASLKVLLKVSERDGYWWVECGSCQSGWQVPFYAESIGARR